MNKYISLILIIGITLFPFNLFATVLIDGTPAGGLSNLTTGSSLVFIGDQVGYKFYVDSNGNGVYSKTTDGGATWRSATVFENQTDIVFVSVWYDRWTPGDTTGNYIHMTAMDTSNDDLYYNRLDTRDDSLLLATGVNISAPSGNSVATVGASTNFHAMTKATDGVLYAGLSDASDSYVVKCSGSCSTGANWVEAGTNPFGTVSQPHPCLLAPMIGGDILLIDRDNVNDTLFSRIYRAGSDSWDTSTSSIDGRAIENASFKSAFSFSTYATSTATSSIWLAYGADMGTLGTDDDIRFAHYHNGWSTTSVATDIAYQLTDVALAIDTYQHNLNLFAATSNGVYRYTASTSNPLSWISNGQVVATTTYQYGITTNFMSDETLQLSWSRLTNGLYSDVGYDIPEIPKPTNKQLILFLE